MRTMTTQILNLKLLTMSQMLKQETLNLNQMIPQTYKIWNTRKN